MRQKWSTADRQFVVETYGTLSAAEQAARLGRTVSSISTERGKLLRAGRIVGSERKYFRLWTEAEDQQLIALVEAGQPMAAIGRRLGRSECAVRRRMAGVLDGIDRHRNNGSMPVRSLSQVARLFGVAPGTVHGWIESGALRVIRSHVGRTPDDNVVYGRVAMGRYLITTADLRVFVRKRELWVWWAPEKLADEGLRRLAEQVRLLAGGRWLDTEAIALELGFAVTTVREWLRRGLLPAQRRGRVFYVWSADLVGFVPPTKAPQRPVRRRRGKR